MGYALWHNKLWGVHLNDQNGLKFDEDKSFGSVNIRRAFNQVYVLEKNGYYHDRRFDWSGLIWQLTYKNHTFFGEVMKPDNKDFNFGISLAEEFGSGMGRENPVGYDEAKHGEPFLKGIVGCSDYLYSLK